MKPDDVHDVHDVMDDPTREKAALHALGEFPPAEAAAYEEHLAACAPCRAETQSLRDVAAELALTAPAALPPSGLRAKLMKRLRASAPRDLRPVPAVPSAGAPAQAWKEWPSQPPAPDGLTLVARDATGWQPTAFAGVEARRLFVDREHERVTMLVRMAAGSSYPPHVHGGPEECYVLEGDLEVGDVVMHAGDYQRVETGVAHPVQSTRGGCLLFLVSSLNDELIGAHA